MRAWLLTPSAVALLAIVLTLPSLGGGLLIDDYHCKLLMRGVDSPARLLDSPLDLFRFFDGTLAVVQPMDYGLLPWWTYPGVRGAFWRPVASLTHWLDYLLWPAWPSLMHLQSILWYAAAVAVVTVVYRRLMGIGPTAGLAAVLFALDYAHIMPIGFLSHRSDLIAMVFVGLALFCHDQWRRNGSRALAFLAPVFVLVALWSKEAAISLGAYLLAYELFIASGPWSRRLLVLVPFIIVVVIWRACWQHLGYGVAEMSFYVDPLAQPTQFALALIQRAPLLLLGQWAFPPPEVTMVVGTAIEVGLWVAAILFGAVLVRLFLPLLRQDRLARFWATGMAISLLPACTTLPSHRMLMFVGFGAMPLMAMYLVFIWHNTNIIAGSWQRKVYSAFGYLLIILHLIVAPLLLSFCVASPAGPHWFLSRIMLTRSFDTTIKDQDLVIINPPESLLVMALPVAWAAEDQPLPRHIRILASSRLQPVKVERSDEHTLIIEPEAGFMAGMTDRLWRGPWRPFAPGNKVRVAGMTAEIIEVTADGTPIRVAFRFDESLEHPSLRWIQWRDGDFVPFVPPAIGRQIALQGGSLIRMLLP